MKIGTLRKIKLKLWFTRPVRDIEDPFLLKIEIVVDGCWGKKTGRGYLTVVFVGKMIKEKGFRSMSFPSSPNLRFDFISAVEVFTMESPQF